MDEDALLTHPLLVTRPTAPKRPPPVPVDATLPQLAEVLDGARIAEVLRPLVHTDHLEVRPRYLRYKPSNKATVLYDIELRGLWTVAILTVARRDLKRVLDRPDTVHLID